MKNGTQLIQDERKRQIEQEGWTPEHDDTHVLGEMLTAAACYRSAAIAIKNGCTVSQARTTTEAYWPWDGGSFKIADEPVRNWVKSGALAMAERERLIRDHCFWNAKVAQCDWFFNEAVNNIDTLLGFTAFERTQYYGEDGDRMVLRGDYSELDARTQMLADWECDTGEKPNFADDLTLHKGIAYWGFDKGEKEWGWLVGSGEVPEGAKTVDIWFADI